MTLTLMSDEVKDGVVCLDGSAAGLHMFFSTTLSAVTNTGAPGFYYSPATSSEYADKWQIYFEGG
jgi:hypothetical protein